VSALALSALGIAAVTRVAATRADDENKVKNGTFIPTGVRITPDAARGSIFQPLNPGLVSDPSFTVGQAVTTAVSPDGKTLLILTSGYNSQNFTSGPNAGETNPAESNEYIFVFDISAGKPLQTQVLQVPHAFDGLAFNPSGKEFYVSGGTDDDVHFYEFSGASWVESGAPVKLGHLFFDAKGNRAGALSLGSVSPGAMGLAVTGDGKRLVVANYENDSVSLIDIARRKVLGELDLRPGSGKAGGSYPEWVAIEGNNTAFVTSARDREILVVDLSGSDMIVTDRIKVNGQPTRLALNPKQTRLYVAESSSDAVAVIKTSSHKAVEEIGTTAPRSVFANEKGFKGSSPNSVTVSRDGGYLYVTNGGANSVAVVRLANESDGDSNDSVGGKSQLVGLIPTGWYPNSASVSADGSMLYVVNGKSNAGPNPHNCRDAASLQPGGSQAGCNASNSYVWQLTKAGFLSLPVPHGEALEDLTAQVARNNYYNRKANNEDKELMAFLHDKIQHVIYIVKENRTYDQILGDLGKGNGDPSIVVYPRPITPNWHALAEKFVDLDNFYDSGEASGDGWNWSTSARAADTIEKTEPVNYAGRGLSYDYEGTNRNVNAGYATPAERAIANPAMNTLPPAVSSNLLLGTADVAAPDSPEGDAGAGYLWDSALRAGLSVRNYGFFIDLARYGIPANIGGISASIRDPFASGTLVSFPTKRALQPITDQYFRGYDNKFPDFYRVNEWEREFDQFEKDGNLPNLEFVRVMHDHTGSFKTAIDGVNTPEIQTADNDYAVGRIVEKVAKSERYRGNTLVFVIEDDSQDGPDHVDAHRSIAFIAGPYVKQGAVVSKNYTTVSMIATIVDVLGIEHLGTYDALEEPMTDVFSTSAKQWDFNAIVPDILRTTQLPLPVKTAKNSLKQDALSAFYAKSRHDAAYWAAKTEGFNFDQADQVDAPTYNRILWQGLVGENVAYPSGRDSRDLSKKRGTLLKQWRESRVRAFTQQQRTTQSGGAN
jgi:DNA-binding beta-propeller fold protein YncE